MIIIKYIETSNLITATYWRISCVIKVTIREPKRRRFYNESINKVVPFLRVYSSLHALYNAQPKPQLAKFRLPIT